MSYRALVSHSEPEEEEQSVKRDGDVLSGKRGDIQEGDPSKDVADVPGATTELLSVEAHTAPAREGVLCRDKQSPPGSFALR